MDLIKIETTINQEVPFRIDLDEKFLLNFKNIFKFGGKEIKVIGTVSNPWFKAKDILKILGYEVKSMKKILHNLNPLFKQYLSELTSTNSVNYHEGKEIYVNEAGLYFLIMRSNLKSAEEFQMYVYKELLPGIRQIIQKRYEEKLSEKDDKIDQALRKLQELGIQLEDTKEEMREIHEDLNNKLDSVLSDRNLDPEKSELKHHYLLLKHKLEDNQYMFIRGQYKYLQNKKDQYKTEYEITIDVTKNPNPVDLINRLKEKITKINSENIEQDIFNLKSTKVYQNSTALEKRSMIQSIKKSKSKLIYRVNKIFLIDYPEESFLNLIKILDQEKYDI